MYGKKDFGDAMKNSSLKKCKNCNRSNLFKIHQYQHTHIQKYMAIKIEENNSSTL